MKTTSGATTVIQFSNQFRANPYGSIQQDVIRNTPSAIEIMRTELVEAARQAGFADNDLFAIELGLVEALENAYCHGNKRDPRKQITVLHDISFRRAQFEIQDEGEGFDDSLVLDPTEVRNQSITHGRGIALMRAYFQKVEYLRGGTCVRLIKLNSQVILHRNRSSEVHDRPRNTSTAPCHNARHHSGTGRGSIKTSNLESLARPSLGAYDLAGMDDARRR